MTIDKELTMKIHRFIIQTLFLLGLWLGVGLQAQAQTGTVTYIYTDQQGTPLAEADVNGNITATFDYAPYGSQALGTAPNGPGYTGHVNDPDTGLVYMQARYYDPSTGRFLSVDPVGPAAGNAFNFSRYAYANNNPVTHTDPDGRQCSQCLYYGDSVEHQASINAAASGMALGVIAGGTPIVGDAMNIQTAIQEPTLSNVAIAAVGAIPEVGGALKQVLKEGQEAISMTTAVEKGAAHVGSDANAVMTKGGNVQFTSTAKDAAGNTVTKNARFDVNPNNAHVQKEGPHLNIETHENGRTVQNDHIPIKPETIRPGDHD